MWLYKSLSHDTLVLKYCFPSQSKSSRIKYLLYQNSPYYFILSRPPEFKNITLNIKTQECYFNELNCAKHQMQECTNKTTVWNRWVITTACYRWHSGTMYLQFGLIKKGKLKTLFYWYNNRMNTVEDLEIHFHK